MTGTRITIRTAVSPRFALMGLVMAGAALVSGVAAAQAYPAKPVRIIVGVPPGGFTDAVARNVAQKLIEATGQQFLVENRTGASGMIAIDAALKSPPDGYTLLLSTNAEMTVNPHVLAKIPYDPFRDFTPIVPVAIAGLVIAANGGAGLNSLQDLVSAARAKPGVYSYASAGNGTVNHLAGEWFASAANIKMVHVPYKGGGPAAQDVVGGQIPLGVLAVSAVIPHLKTGRVKVLAVTSAKRPAFAPDLPTVAESGFPGFEVSLWAAFFGQPGIPREVVSRINAEVNRALGLSDVRERLHTIGAEALGGTPEDVSTLIRNDHARYGRVARENNIRAD
jgi:tripartite-type tricarboxylate transporter receptor subunit TctC